MKKRIRVCLRAVLCCALCAVLLCACVRQSAGPAAASGAVPTDPLTGQQAQYTGQRVVGVTIDSTAETMWGIGSAPLVLEALMQNGQPSSLCLVYSAVEEVPQVGPVSAGQDLFWRLLSAQQVLPVQRGGGVYNTNYLAYYNISPVDALEVGRNAFSCANTWANAPLWYTSGSALNSVLGSLNLSGALSAADNTVLRQTGEDGTESLSVPALLPFDAQTRLPEATAQGAANVELRFDASNVVSFVYDAQTGTYGMLRGGTAQLDANDGQQAMFDNLLILYSASTVRDDGKTLDYDLSVGGGVWLHSGELYNITWQQGSDTTLALYDEDGRQLALTPGRSYLALVASVTGDELHVTNTSGEVLY